MSVDFRPRSRRTGVLATIFIAAALALPAGASALGPGGWDNLGQVSPTTGPLNGKVNALNTDMAGKLIAGGTFTAAGQAAGNTIFDDGVAIWDGTSWSPLRGDAGTPGDSLLLPGGEVTSLEYDPGTGKIYAGGSFGDSPALPKPDFLAVWDTNNTAPGWQQLCAPGLTNGGLVSALKIIGSTLFVGGAGQDWAGLDGADELFRCQLGGAGTVDEQITPTDTGTGTVNGLTADSLGNLYATGGFTDWGGLATADRVLKYSDPTGVSPTLSGTGGAFTDDFADSLVANGTDIYVGTREQNVAGLPTADHVVKWNGGADMASGWSAVGGDTGNDDGYLPFTTYVTSLAISGSRLFAVGTWLDADGDATSDMAAQIDLTCTPTPTETCWEPIGTDGAINGSLNNPTNAAAIYNNSLIAGGIFQNAGGENLADFIGCFSLGVTPCTPAPVVTPPPAAITPIVVPPDVVKVIPKKCKKSQKLKRGKCVKKKKKK